MVLRVPGTSISAYYAIAPLLAVYLAISSPGVWRRASIVGAIVIYGWCAGFMFGTPAIVMAKQTVFYALAYLTIEAIFCGTALQPSGFIRKAESFLDFAFAALVTIVVIQTALNFDLPGTWGYRSMSYSSAVFYTPNDLALFLTAYLVLVVFGSKDVKWKALIAVLVLGINVYNESRLAIAANSVTIAAALAISLISGRVKYPLAAFFGGVVAAIAVVAVAGIAFRIELVQQVGEALRRIFTLDQFRLAGSIYDRTDALIIGLREYFQSGGIGLGPGGSAHLFTLPWYHGMTAESLHFALAEFAVDLGPPFWLAFLILVARTFWTLLWRERPSASEVGQFVILISLPVLSMIQSSGFISNYGAWAALTLVWLRAEKVSRNNPD